MRYDLKTAPMAHQKKGMQKLRKRPSAPSSDDVFAWLMDMGTGKSWCVLKEYVDYVNEGEIVDLLVVAPAGSYRNWYVDKGPDELCELNKHVPRALLDKMEIMGWQSGGGARYQRELAAFLASTGPRAFFVNVEALSSTSAAREACLTFLRRGRALAVHDESTSGKNPGAKRTKFLNQKLAPMAPARRIMTGLLTPKSPMDVYAQFEFLDWRILGFRSFYAFRARYAVMERKFFGGRRVDIIVAYRNVEELQKKIAPYSYRVLKKDCLDLDPKTYLSWEVTPTDEQRKAYNEMLEFATTELSSGDHVTATIVIAKIARLQQILLGYVKDENGTLHEIPSNRVDELLKILEQHDGKAIIWCFYIPLLKKIVERLSKEYGENAVAQFHGGNRGTRHLDERRFLNDPRCKFMCASQGAGGKGNTWIVADLEIYVANSDNLEHRDQSEDRPHRKGQTKPVTVMDMYVPKTVETKIVKSLRKKINMATTITGENYREWLV